MSIIIEIHSFLLPDKFVKNRPVPFKTVKCCLIPSESNEL